MCSIYTNMDVYAMDRSRQRPNVLCWHQVIANNSGKPFQHMGPDMCRLQEANSKQTHPLSRRVHDLSIASQNQLHRHALELYLNKVGMSPSSSCHSNDAASLQCSSSHTSRPCRFGVSAPKAGEVPCTYVETRTGLSRVKEALGNVAAFGVDLEHNHTRSYHGTVCLMQLSTGRTQNSSLFMRAAAALLVALQFCHDVREGLPRLAGDLNFVIDVLQVRDDMAILRDLFANEDIVKVHLQTLCNHTHPKRTAAIR